jgi:hypothetical protein
MTNLHLDLYWRSRHPSRADDARRLSRFVTGLPDFDSIYRSWLESPETRQETAPVPLSEAVAERLLIENITRYDLPPDPWPEAGSCIWGGHAGPPPYDFREASYADTLCSIGAYGERAGGNSIQMRLSDVRPSTGQPWRASELRPLMKFAREIWRPTEMRATLTFFEPQKIPDPTWASGERTLEPRIGWITCLPPNLAARAKYPADVEVETLADGAVLVTLCEEPFGKDDAMGLARLHALEAALRPLQG